MSHQLAAVGSLCPRVQIFPLIVIHAPSRYGPDCPALALARQTPNERLLHFGLFYRKVKPVWHQGRVALLGDSAHATLPYAGQGANQAIEDAVVLAQCLEVRTTRKRWMTEAARRQAHPLHNLHP